MQWSNLSLYEVAQNPTALLPGQDTVTTIAVSSKNQFS